MNYEVVTLAEKIVVGVSATTGQNDPDMMKIISGLWVSLYQGGINAAIQNKVNEYAIGLYSDYEGDRCCVTAGNEVSKAENPDLSVKVIPAGRYAKFSIHGHMERAVGEAWDAISKMDLPRSFTGDFEEYLSDSMDDCDIDIYIALQ